MTDWRVFDVASLAARPHMTEAEYLDIRIKARDRLAAACRAGTFVDLSDLITRCTAALGSEK